MSCRVMTMATALLLVMVLPLAASAAWQTAGGSPARNYAVDEELARAVYQRWEFQTGSTVFTQPAISGDTLFVGTDCGVLHAVDTRTGQEKWRLETEPRSRIRMTPSVSGGLVFFGTADGSFYCLDRASGETKWRKALSGWVTGSPIVTSEMIYVSCYQGKVHAIKHDGSEAWVHSTEGDFISAPLVLLPEGIAVGTMSGAVSVLHSTTGMPIWKQALDGWISGIAFSDVHKTLVATSAGLKIGGVYSLHASSGERAWRYRSPDNNYWSAPAINQGSVWVGNLGNLVALNLGNGERAWALASPPARVRVQGVLRTFYPSVKTPVFTRSGGYALSAFEVSAPARMLSVLECGDQVNSWNLPIAPSAAPAVSGDSIYLCTSSGTVQAWAEVKMVVSGKRVAFGSTPPVILGNSSLAPVRPLVEHVGGQIMWDPATSRIEISVGSNTVKLTANSKDAVVNGVATIVNPVPQIIWGRVYVPIRFLSENVLNSAVSWDPISLTITVGP